MRPLSITLEGFSAYRERSSVSFAEVDFFSLSGPTGSGKSSLIDAMIFALYGRVPRLGGREVAPVISAGADRARVSVDFAVGDQVYTVTRQVLRTKTGANTNEARLERGLDVLAHRAEDVTKAVEDVLGLRYEDFTKTVVLPQGEFARFLTATKSDRQALLRKLLDLDIYAEIRGLARTREAAAEERAAQARGRRDALEIPDEQTLTVARDRLGQLDEMADRIGDHEARVAGLEDAAKAADESVSRLEGDLERLESIRPPDNLEMLDEAINRARDGFEEIEKRRDQVKAEMDAANVALLGLPSTESLESHARTYLRLTEIDSRLTDLGLAAVESRIADAIGALQAITDVHQQLTSELESARVTHAAHALRATLVVGEPCPVCDLTVARLPADNRDPDLIRVEEAEREGGAKVSAARAALETARSEGAKVEATRNELETQRGSLLNDLAPAPPVETLQDQMMAVAAAKSLLAERQHELEVVDGLLATTRRELETAAEAFRSVGRDLMAARERVADLQPPLPESDDNLIRWKELMGWVDSTRLDIRSRIEKAGTAARAAATEAASARERLVAELESIGIEAVAPFAVQVAREQEQAKQAVKEMERTISLAGELTVVLEEAETSAAIAHSLAGHLRADGFERWLMAGAVADLVLGANELLAQLSGGGFSLYADDDGGFAIIDHRNADETRSVATLSGGETFLVALALALSLAETLSAGSTSGLDAIFLDEGFGTLDEESLDTVASVLEELTGRGLMVGIVTHVKELAARATVRLEVRREPTGSVVEVVS
ncbi:MAG TPA: SMC family ATPase [Acidimicrobiia bacterium]|nr:SMC family ATPase [Acidimicrobiia bacterium]